jgi:hypothetical protein
MQEIVNQSGLTKPKCVHGRPPCQPCREATREANSATKYARTIDKLTRATYVPGQGHQPQGHTGPRPAVPAGLSSAAQTPRPDPTGYVDTCKGCGDRVYHAWIKAEGRHVHRDCPAGPYVVVSGLDPKLLLELTKPRKIGFYPADGLGPCNMEAYDRGYAAGFAKRAADYAKRDRTWEWTMFGLGILSGAAIYGAVFLVAARV